MKRDEIFARIGADNDQDRMAAREWMKEATTADKFAVWAAIQKDYDDPVMEIISRFAQLAFAEIMVEVDAANKEARDE